MKKLLRFSSFVVLLVIIMNTWFTWEVLKVFEKVGSEPSVLIGAFFGFTTGELWLLATIKKHKIKKENIE